MRGMQFVVFCNIDIREYCAVSYSYSMAMVVAKTKRVVSDSKSRVQRHYEDDTLIVIGELGASSDVVLIPPIYPC